MQIEWTVTIGNIMSAITAIGAVLIAGWKISVQLKVMQIKMNMVWRWYAKEHGIENGREIELGD